MKSGYIGVWLLAVLVLTISVVSVRAGETILFSDNFDSEVLDPNYWDEEISDPATSSLVIEGGRLKVTFRGGSGYTKVCYAVAKNVSLPGNWSKLRLRGTWGYQSGGTGEGRMTVFKGGDTSHYMRCGCGSWEGPFLCHSDSCGNGASNYSYDFPTQMTPFEWTITPDSWQYAEDGTVWVDENCDAIADACDVQFKLGGQDMSALDNVYYFDDIELTVEIIGEDANNPVVIDAIPFTATGDSCIYSDDYDGCCGDANSGADVVYQYDAQTDITVDVSMADSQYDTRLYVYEDVAGDSSNCIACSNDDINGDRSILYNVSLTAGHNYYIVADGDNNDCGDYALYVFLSRDPSCTTWYVKTNGNDYDNGQSWDSALEHIGKAISRSGNGHTIVVADGTYCGTGNRALTWKGSTKHLTVKSANGPENCIIDCENETRGFDFYNQFLTVSDTIEGFSIINGAATPGPTLGGGIRIAYNSSPTISNCILSGNAGSAIYIFYASNPVISNCAISGNFGRGIYCDGSNNIINPTITNCTIMNNTGSGISCYNYASPTVSNCVISGNQATEGGGIYLFFYSSPTIRNCTIADNLASTGGGIFCHSYCYPKIVNSILWNNTATGLGPEIRLLRFDKPSVATISYCDIDGGTTSVHTDENCYANWGYGCIDVDPCFVDVAEGNYQLKSAGWRWIQNMETWTWDNVTSECIDAGNPGSALGSELMAIPRDEGNVYGVNLRVNMGAYGAMGQASMAPPGWALLTDINNDGTSDVQDLTCLVGYWLTTQTELPADFDRSGRVGLLDFAAMAADWLKETPWY